MDRTTRRDDKRTSLSSTSETAVLVGLATLAVIQGGAAAWGIIAGVVRMFALLLRI